MDPNLLMALLSLFGAGGNSFYTGGASPQGGSGSGGIMDLLSLLGLFGNSPDQSLGGGYGGYGGGGYNFNNPYGPPAGYEYAQNGQLVPIGTAQSDTPGYGGNNAASLLFQFLFGPQAQQQAINQPGYQQTFYNPQQPAGASTGYGTTQPPQRIDQPGPSGGFTGYAAPPAQQGQGYSPYAGPGGYIDVNGQPTWAPGTGALGGTPGSGAMTRSGLPAGSQTPTAWGPLTLGDNGRWSGAPNLPNLGTVAHGLYGGDIPTMVGADGQILYNPGAAGGQPYDQTHGWVTWEQMDDITTKLYTDRGLPLPPELAAANARRGQGLAPEQRAAWGNTGFRGYVAPGTNAPYTPSPGYTPPAAGGGGGGGGGGGAPPPPGGAPPPYNGATSLGWLPPGWSVNPNVQNTVTSPWGTSYDPKALPSFTPVTIKQTTPISAGTAKNFGSTFFNPVVTPTYPAPPAPPRQTKAFQQPAQAPKSKSGQAPYWDAGIGKWYDPGTNSYY